MYGSSHIESKNTGIYWKYVLIFFYQRVDFFSLQGRIYNILFRIILICCFIKVFFLFIKQQWMFNIFIWTEVNFWIYVKMWFHNQNKNLRNIYLRDTCLNKVPLMWSQLGVFICGVKLHNHLDTCQSYDHLFEPERNILKKLSFVSTIANYFDR